MCDECPDCGYQKGDDFTVQGERSELESLRNKLAEMTKDRDTWKTMYRTAVMYEV